MVLATLSALRCVMTVSRASLTGMVPANVDNDSNLFNYIVVWGSSWLDC